MLLAIDCGNTNTVFSLWDGRAFIATWRIATDHGETELVLKGEEDIRRLANHGLLIADKHGIHSLIRDRQALDAVSRKILDRFL